MNELNFDNELLLNEIINQSIINNDKINNNDEKSIYNNTDLEILEYKYIGSNNISDKFTDKEFISCLKSSPNVNQISLILAKNITDQSINYLVNKIPKLLSLEIIRCESLTEQTYITIMDTKLWYNTIQSLTLRGNKYINYYYVLNLLERYKKCNEFDLRNNINLNIKDCIRYLINPLNYETNYETNYEINNETNYETCYTIISQEEVRKEVEIEKEVEKKEKGNNNKEEEFNIKEVNKQTNLKEILIMCSCSLKEKYQNNTIILENNKKRLIFHFSE